MESQRRLERCVETSRDVPSSRVSYRGRVLRGAQGVKRGAAFRRYSAPRWHKGAGCSAGLDVRGELDRDQARDGVEGVMANVVLEMNTGAGVEAGAPWCECVSSESLWIGDIRAALIGGATVRPSIVG